MGGAGAEREVSLDSGEYVTLVMKDAGLNVTACDITPEDTAVLNDESIDVFFLAVHGQFGEDGQLQEILEHKKLTYTG